MNANVQFPHLKVVDLYKDGTVYEVAVVKEADNGDLYFIKIMDLDEIDRRRLRQILTKRNAFTTPLWDLMDQTTLPNGMNALEFFHQFVKVRAPSGKIFSPQLGRMGAGRPQQQVITERKAGRPPKAAAATEESKA